MTHSKVDVMTQVEVETMIEDILENKNEHNLKLGKALKYMKDHGLYPKGKGFAKHVDERFDISPTRAKKLIQAFEIWFEHEMELSGCNLTRESLLELGRLKDTKQRSKAIRIAVRKSKSPNFSTVRKAVNEVLGIPSVEPESESEQQEETEPKAKAEPKPKTPEEFRSDFHNLLERLTENWAPSIGIETMKQIIVEEAFKIKVSKAA